MTEKWEKWEHHVQEVLGLDSTICSGNKFHDPGDATSNVSPRDDSFRLLVDCKYTTKGSFSLKNIEMKQWILRGVERGKRSILAIRIWPRGMVHSGDYVILEFDDFAELWEKARHWDKSNQQGQDKPSPDSSGWTDRSWLERDEYQGRGWSNAV